MSNGQPSGDKPRGMPDADGKRRQGTEGRGAKTEPTGQPTDIPLLSEIVIPGPTLTEVGMGNAAMAPPIPPDNTPGGTEQSLDRLIPTLATLLEAGIREALYSVSQQIVRNILAELRQPITPIPGDTRETPKDLRTEHS